MMTSTLLAIVTSFSFPGGSDNELVGALSKTFSRPVVLLADGTKPWHAINETAKSETLLMERLGGSFRIRASAALGISGLGWPSGIAFKYASRYNLNRRMLQGLVAPDSQGRFSVETSGKEVFGLTQVQLGKGKLRWHWFYGNAYLTASVKGCPSHQFLDCLANSLGASLIIDESGANLGFDAVEFKRRSLAAASSINPARQIPKGLDVEIWFRALVLRPMTDEAIAKAFETPQTMTRIAAEPGSALYEACMNRVQWKYGDDPTIMQLIKDNAGDNPKVEAMMRAGGAMSVGINSREKKWGIML